MAASASIVLDRARYVASGGSASGARATAHAGIVFVLLAVYGVEVCPFLEALDTFELILPLAAGCVAWLLMRRPVHLRLVRTAPEREWTLRALLADAGLFALAGLLVAAFNGLTFGTPVGSGVKVLVGFSAIGFFAAVDLALDEEHALSRRLLAEGRAIELSDRYLPFTLRAAAFTGAMLLVVAVVVMLTVVKDLDWLAGQLDREAFAEARRAVLLEVGFVTAVMLGYAMNAIAAHARNLHLVLEGQRAALERVAANDLSARLPVTTDDEFARAASLTNATIDVLAARTAELERTRAATILGLTSLAESRDNETGAHILRTQRYVRALAEALRDHPRFRDALDDATIDLLFASAPLHDVGKVGIPDAILLKPGKLTDEEFEVMKTHAVIGAEALARAGAHLGETDFLRVAREIAESHHERWDGSGYPHGLAGEDIPVSGRLMALADVYDALISARCYKPAFSHAKARAIILEGRGSHFDPAVVDAFLAVEDRFVAIAAEYADEV